MSDRLTVAQAKERGYQWARIGWNHARGVPLMAPVEVVAQFCYGGTFTEDDLEKVHRYMYPLAEEPTADIPMEGR